MYTNMCIVYDVMHTGFLYVIHDAYTHPYTNAVAATAKWHIHGDIRSIHSSRSRLNSNIIIYEYIYIYWYYYYIDIRKMYVCVCAE